MTDKSYVTMEQKVCPACGKTFDSGALLMDMRLRDRFEKNTTTGWELCPDDQAKVDDGYKILVGANPRSLGRYQTRVQPEDAIRTGDILYLRNEVFDQMFDVETDSPMVFVEPEVVKQLKIMADKVSGHGEQTDAED